MKFCILGCDTIIFLVRAFWIVIKEKYPDVSEYKVFLEIHQVISSSTKDTLVYGDRVCGVDFGWKFRHSRNVVSTEKEYPEFNKILDSVSLSLGCSYKMMD